MRIKSDWVIGAMLAVSFYMTFEVTAQTRRSTYVKSRLVLDGSGTPEIRQTIGAALTAVLQEANRIKAGWSNNLKNVERHCSPEGFIALKTLVERTGFFSVIPEYKTNLIETPQGQYEVRGIKVGVPMGETQGDPTQFLVFTLTKRGDIANVQFAIETTHYERLMEEGRGLNDMIYRKQILGFLEDYRTAHNLKDIDYLEQVYSEEALIIVGRVLKNKKTDGDYLANSLLGETQVQLIKRSKREYIDSLRQAFKRNAFVKVTFDKIEIVRHSRFPDFYGIKVEQQWNSSRYSDHGYLFIMIDFEKPESPVIHVRAWQPEKFHNGSVVELGYFKILRPRKK